MEEEEGRAVLARLFASSASEKSFSESHLAKSGVALMVEFVQRPYDDILAFVKDASAAGVRFAYSLEETAKGFYDLGHPARGETRGPE